MIHIEIKHYLNDESTKVIKTEKTLKIFGITIKRKTFYYPENRFVDVIAI